MNATIEYVDFSSDDARWSRPVDPGDLSDFLAKPKEWIAQEWEKVNQKGTLTDHFGIRLVKRKLAEDSKIRIGGTAHISQDTRISNSVSILVDAEAIAANAGPNGLSSLWDEVAAIYPQNTLSMQLTYTLSNDLTSGPVNVHMEMPPITANIAKLISAIMVAPSGLQTWLETQQIELERWVDANGTFTPIARQAGIVSFASKGTITASVYIYPTLIGLPNSACNADDGHYTGNPTTEDTNIDINDMEFKFY